MTPPDSDNPFPSDGDDPKFNYSYMAVNAAELEYLQSYWEIRDIGQLFGWAWRLLHDLSKADEQGWVMALQKAEINETTKKVYPNPNYRAASFRLKWMIPEDEGFFRIPVDKLEEMMKKHPASGEPKPKEEDFK